MHSFVYEKDQTKIISAQKPLPKAPTPAMNPFYQFITNMKSSNITLPIETPVNQKPSSVSIPTQPSVSSQRKNSSELSDPRKVLGLNRINPSQANPTSKKPQISMAPRNHEPREKRSRSRQKKISQNRQNSQSQSGKEKQHEFYRKTRLCPMYEKGECIKDSSHCNFAHGFQQLRCYKTQLCYAFERGQCKKPTEQCKYAHGKKQIRAIKDDDHEPLKNKSQKREKNHYSQEKNKINHKDNHKDNHRDNHKDNHRYNYKDNHKDRDSESVHRYDRKDKNNGSRVDQYSKHSKKEKYQVVPDPLSYKKNLPLNKEYEKFLYGDSNPKVIPAQSNNFSNNQDSMYMIQNFSPNLPKNPYSMEAYSIDLGKNFEFYPRSQIPSGYSQLERPYQDLLKQKEGLREPQVPFYEKPSVEFHKQSYPYMNQVKPFSDKKYYPEISYPEMSRNTYGKVDYVNPYQAPSSSDLGQDLSRYPYKNTNQGGFNEQPFSHGASKVDNFADSVYQRGLPSGYSQVSKPIGRPEDFYRNGSFNSGRQPRKHEFEGMVAGGNHNSSSNRKDFSGHGGYNGYPMMDNNINQVGKGMGRYPGRPYDQKGKNSNFSNKGYQ